MKKTSLRLGPLPDTASHKITVVLSASAKAELERYAEVYSTTYGRHVEPADLIPFIVSIFIARDRQYKRMQRVDRDAMNACPCEGCNTPGSAGS